jgi:RimJ/RimL family protein N-acetyltransferase
VRGNAIKRAPRIAGAPVGAEGQAGAPWCPTPGEPLELRSAGVVQREITDAEARAALVAWSPGNVWFVDQFNRGMARDVRPGSWYRWLSVLERATGEQIAVTPIYVDPPNAHGQISSGGLVRGPYRRRGFATEAGALQLAYMFDVLGSRRVVVAAHYDNPARLRLCAKWGLEPLPSSAWGWRNRLEATVYAPKASWFVLRRENYLEVAALVDGCRRAEGAAFTDALGAVPPRWWHLFRALLAARLTAPDRGQDAPAKLVALAGAGR